jgi:hypothetical protein
MVVYSADRWPLSGRVAQRQIIAELYTRGRLVVRTGTTGTGRAFGGFLAEGSWCTVDKLWGEKDLRAASEGQTGTDGARLLGGNLSGAGNRLRLGSVYNAVKLNTRRPVVLVKHYGVWAALGLILASFSACAWALDQDPQPLFMIRNGRRVPVAVVTARRPVDSTQHAVLEVVEAGTASEQVESGYAGPLDRPSDVYGGAAGPYGGPGTRQEIAYYGGYPVSYYFPTDTSWWDSGPAFSNPYNSDYGEAPRQMYRAQRYIYERERGRRFNEADMQQRKERVLNSFDKALRTGLDDLKCGDYAQAMVALTMATQLNQGDPASRIHLAQAQMALGHYDEAGQAVRRALQLQPNLRFVPLDLQKYYSDARDFDQHVSQLVTWLKQHPASADVYFLLGFMEFQREDFNQAYAAFQIALRGAPNDVLVREYLKLTKSASR